MCVTWSAAHAADALDTQLKLISTLRMQLSKNAVKERLTLRQEFQCGADRDRTDDIQLAKLALSQLSYSPSRLEAAGMIKTTDHGVKVLGRAFFAARFTNELARNGPRWT